MVCPSAHRLGSRGIGLYRGQVEKTKKETETETSRDWMVDVVSGASVRLGDIPGTSRKVAASFDRWRKVPGLLIIQLAFPTGNLDTGWA